MKSFALGLGLFLSTLAYGENCVSHGQCQKNHELKERTFCALVEYGIDPMNGDLLCTVRCYTVPMGYYCAKPPGKLSGKCKAEYYPSPRIDSVPQRDCSNALSEDELPNA